MPEANSPLRYPGGKAVLSDFLASVIEANNLGDCIYVEPYAGGAGAAINLLLAGKVERIILNDADRNIWSFWKAILDHTETFLDRVDSTPITVGEWRRQRKIYENPRGHSIVERGFAAFFLNRCNRSGIIMNGGVIGGLDQTGKWKIDARFNRIELRRRIERIAAYRDNIQIANMDAVKFLKTYVLSVADRSRYFAYLDPPYYVKGSHLYLNYYEPTDHAVLARFLRRIRGLKWLVTYDAADEIRSLYEWCTIIDFNLLYSAHSSREGSEIVISPDGLAIPSGTLRGYVA
jgi:DNA adenine methylase